MARGCREYLVVPFQFGNAVVTQGLGLILFRVGAVKRSVEDVVGSDMNQSGSTLRAEAGKASGALGVDPVCQSRVTLASVDVGGRRAVNDNIPCAERLSHEPCFGVFRVGEVDLGTGDGNHFRLGKRFPSTDKSRAKAPIRSKNDHIHGVRMADR